MDQGQLAVFALDYEQKFLNHMPGHKWPLGMASTWQNLLRSTVLDSEIKSYMENEDEMLPTPLELLQKFDPHVDRRLMKIFKWKMKQSQPLKKH